MGSSLYEYTYFMCRPCLASVRRRFTWPTPCPWLTTTSWRCCTSMTKQLNIYHCIHFNTTQNTFSEAKVLAQSVLACCEAFMYRSTIICHFIKSVRNAMQGQPKSPCYTPTNLKRIWKISYMTRFKLYERNQFSLTREYGKLLFQSNIAFLVRFH